MVKPLCGYQVVSIGNPFKHHAQIQQLTNNKLRAGGLEGDADRTRIFVHGTAPDSDRFDVTVAELQSAGPVVPHPYRPINSTDLKPGMTGHEGAGSLGEGFGTFRVKKKKTGISASNPERAANRIFQLVNN